MGGLTTPVKSAEDASVNSNGPISNQIIYQADFSRNDSTLVAFFFIHFCEGPGSETVYKS